MTSWWQPSAHSYPNHPDHPNHLNPLNFHNFCNDFDPSIAVVPHASGDMGLSMAQSVAGLDVTMSFADLHCPASSNEHLTPNNATPPPQPAHQNEMAASLKGVGDRFAGYDSPGAFSMTVEGSQGHRPRQRRPRARAPSLQEWEDRKNAIFDLYIRNNLTLAATLGGMKRTYGFHATQVQAMEVVQEYDKSLDFRNAQ
ncbi:hypothetical protein Trisim1_003228 [Trichoderma cf. simile WF8]